MSDQSSTSFPNLGDALRYCSGLTEGSYTDWYLPTYDELTYLMSKGGVTVSNNTSTSVLWTRTKFPNNTGGTTTTYAQSVASFRMSTGESLWLVAGSDTGWARCVR